MRGNLILAVVALCLLGISGCGHAAAVRTAAGPELGEVLGRGVSGYGWSYLHPTPSLSAKAAFPVDGTHDVVVTWSRYASSAFEMESLVGFAEQRFAVRYQPTAVEFIGPERLVVAGFSGNRVIVEEWTLKLPTEKIDAATGVVTLYPQERKRVREVLSELLAPTMGVVTQMAWNRANTDSLFCLFSLNRDIQELSWWGDGSPGVLVPIASAAQYSALAGKPFDYHTAGYHSLHGFIYLFGVWGEADLHTSVVLRDGDRDGVIDLITPMDGGQLVSLQLHDIQLWHEYNGLDAPW